MKQSKLSIRVNRKNSNHHIWNNNGKWWCHLTLHHPDYTSERRRLSLNTRNLDVARQRRDRLFANLENTVARKAVAA